MTGLLETHKINLRSVGLSVALVSFSEAAKGLELNAPCISASFPWGSNLSATNLLEKTTTDRHVILLTLVCVVVFTWDCVLPLCCIVDLVLFDEEGSVCVLLTGVHFLQRSEYWDMYISINVIHV